MSAEISERVDRLEVLVASATLAPAAEDLCERVIADMRTLLARQEAIHALAARMREFKPHGELGPLFAAGQEFAYRDGAGAILEILTWTK